MIKEKVGIIGCGWLGYRFAQYLKDYFEIHSTVTSPGKIKTLTSEGFHPELVNFEKTNNDAIGWQPWEKLHLLDHIIITVPLFSRRIDRDRLNARIRNISRFIAAFNGSLTLMSSVGVYQQVSGAVTEDMLPAKEVEGEKEITKLFRQVNILRLGG
ncbi:Rossmann-fold NAD(P)-binding domain-containing protein [Niabella hibiscisoli]|uniref:hypothetical protein n=1 Tax=Niabella hibiscisoli TaxID=1825928 RepID=UPI001F0DAB99|nr:hypothetical protein [Niabella hibiscisoli]MCH5719561.1 hypothetical protein [Niabella hibiscisoli]